MLAFTHTFGRLRSSFHQTIASQYRNFCAMPVTTPQAAMSTINCDATLAVGEDGTLTLDARQEAPILEAAPASCSNTRTLWLNRPRALHALSQSMLQRIRSRLERLEADESVKCIVLRSTGTPGRAFCAGGDIRHMYSGAANGDYNVVDEFFRVEYSLDAYIAALQTPIISLWDGIVMGGGVGLSVHGKFRVATENTVFAMPECAIGLHPDIGASYFLPRLRGIPYAAYASLTGARIRGQDSKTIGLATHYVASHQVDALVQRLEAVDVSTFTAIDKVIREFEDLTVKAPAYPTPEMDAVIERCFGMDSVEGIVEALHKTVNDGGNEEEAAFANEALEAIKKASPASLKVSLESMKRGGSKGMTVNQCLEQEFRLSARCLRERNLVEGVGAAVIDRTKKPTWNPATIEEMKQEEVDRYFASLEDLGLEELVLLKQSKM